MTANSAANPFTPTFGHVPFALAGRSDYIDDVIGGLANRPGDPNRSTIFVGSRGTGKTVLLTAIAREAAGLGWVAVNVSARDGLLDEVLWQLRANAAHLLSNSVDDGFDITSLKAGPVAESREMHRELPSWRVRLGAMIDELNGNRAGVLIAIDEVNPDCAEFSQFIDAYQHFVREGKDVALLLAGLPSRVSAFAVS